MRNPTSMMKEILTSERAQEIIDWVSPIYGNSYVGLWIYEAIGAVLDNLCDISDNLRYETSPETTTLLMSYWEQHYGIPEDSSLTMDQRRIILIGKIQDRGPINPTRLAAAVSASLGGVEVDITERTGPNKFKVNIREVVPSILPAVAVLERKKPAHLIYDIQVATQSVAEADIQIAIAMTRAERFSVEVQG